jgi:hypothetical protein
MSLVAGALQLGAAPSSVSPHPTEGGTTILGLRNLFGRPQPGQMFTANDRMPNPHQVPESVRVLMRRLAHRMRQPFAWPDTLAGASAPGDNPKLASGYTYLLQLMAHDIVDSSFSLGGAGGAGFGFANGRQIPLALETIYGGGPENSPQVYEISAAHLRTLGTVPRTRLRTGKLKGKKGQALACPFRDIGRARPAATSDSSALGRKVPLTEVLLADARNDSHALISQITVLFHRFHNVVDDLIQAAQRAEDASQHPPEVAAYVRFACARLAATLVYREIVLKDVLPRILHPAVADWYARHGHAPVDASRGVPVEFSHGAFRFGHAMVRDQYLLTAGNRRDMSRGLLLSSQRAPGALPMPEDWRVDWELFFPPDGATVPNKSRRLAPQYAFALRDEQLFPAVDPSVDTFGLAARDLVSGCFAGFWSVPVLFSEIRRAPLKSVLPDFTVWHEPLRHWLRDRSGTFADYPDEEDIADLVADPPLPFFVLFEAAHSGSGSAPVSVGGGAHLGPFGSIIVAETILGCLRDHPISFERAGSALSDRLEAAGREMIGDASALAPLAGIGSMAALVRFVG